MKKNINDWMSVAEAALALGVTRQAIYDALKRGAIKGHKNNFSGVTKFERGYIDNLKDWEYPPKESNKKEG